MNDAAPSSGLDSLRRSLRSWRTASVVLLSFSSGLPLGLVWYAIPDWMRDIGVDIRVVGILTLAQAPWAFKVLWSPLMDRYVPPFWGRRRGWMAISQVALVACGLLLAGVGSHPDAIWVVGAIALATAMASASQDIAYDAYTVDVLRPEEQGAAVGARTAAYRAAMAVSGGAAITAAAQWGWPFVNLLLAALYLPMLVLTWKAPEPEYVQPPATLRDAVWHPFLELLSRPRALEILAFVVLYKFADQLAQALTRPFLIDMGYNAYHRGVALATVGLRRHGGRRAHRRLGHDHRRTGTLALDLRRPADLFESRIFRARACQRTERAADVRRDQFRALHVGPRDRCLLGAVAAAHEETFLRDAVRAVLEPVRAAASRRRTGDRLCGPRHRLAGVLSGHDGHRCSRTRDAGALRPARRARSAVRHR